MMRAKFYEAAELQKHAQWVWHISKWWLAHLATNSFAVRSVWILHVLHVDSKTDPAKGGLYSH